MDRQLIGRRAEELACQYLQAHGAEILLRNYRCRLGELDIVARLGATLLVAEVRLRRHAGYGGAAASVTRDKCRRIVLATRHLLARRPALQAMPVRFDVLVVPPGEARSPASIEWLQAAFDAA